MAFRDYPSTGRPSLFSVGVDYMRRGRAAAEARDGAEAIKLYGQALLRLNESYAIGKEAALAHCHRAIEAVRNGTVPDEFVPAKPKALVVDPVKKVNPTQARKTADAMARFRAAHAKWNGGGPR